MSNFKSYQDVIERKIEENKDLKRALSAIKYNTWPNGEVQFKGSNFLKKITIKDSILIKLIEELIEKNDKMLETYLSLSFRDELKQEGENENESRVTENRPNN